jgi:hypothetical protein
VKLIKVIDGEWVKSGLTEWWAKFHFNPDCEYRLVTKERVDVALHYFNGGEIQVYYPVLNSWKEFVAAPAGFLGVVSANQYRIKPTDDYTKQEVSIRLSSFIKRWEDREKFYFDSDNPNTKVIIKTNIDLVVCWNDNNLYVKAGAI